MFGGKPCDHQVQLLDRLQKEVDGVLEQTARLLATSNANNKAVTGAQATKLKALLPGAESRFNDALDNLSEEIMYAQLVVRRDLAVAREASGIPKPVTQKAAPMQTGTSPKRSSPLEADTVAREAKRVKLTPNERAEQAEGPQPDVKSESRAAPEVEEVDSDAEASEAVKLDTAAGKLEPSTPPTDSPRAKNYPAALSNPARLMSDESKDVAAEFQGVAAPSAGEASTPPTLEPPPEQQPSDPTLRIDTQPRDTTVARADQPPDSSKAPDTAVTNNDLDSLFGGPTTSVPAGGEADAPEDFDPNNIGDGDFDFGLPTTDDNDNISALLPGLQDYANNHPGDTGDADFDNIFNTDLGGESGGQEGENQGNGGLNDFLDFDFGADFAGDGEGGDGNAAANANLGDPFEFDFS